MAFDRHSIRHRAADWYPLPCRLSHSIAQDSGHEQQGLRSAPEERRFDIACFLPSLRDLADATFEAANELVQSATQLGAIKVDQVERGEINQLLKTETAPQETESTATLRAPLPSAAGTASSNNVGKSTERLCNAISETVNDSGSDGQKIAILLDSHKDNFGAIRELITKAVVRDAARNETCGYHIMTTLLNRLKDKVCQNISTGVVKAAAGNQKYGGQIMEKLLIQCEGVVCEKISVTVICAAAENIRFGAQILDLLRKANEEKVKKHILDTFREAEEGKIWPAEVRSRLQEKLEEIGFQIGYPLNSGRQVKQYRSVAERQYGVDGKQGSV